MFYSLLFVTERNVTWAYGKDICARRGMYLLSPRTSFEADRVADTIMQMAGNKSQDAQLKRTEFNVYIGKSIEDIKKKKIRVSHYLFVPL